MKRIFWMLCGLSLALIAWGFYEAFFVAPTEATMGDLQRIFYWHVPIASSALVFPYANMIASIAYLIYRRSNHVLALKMDAFANATAEITVLYSGLGLCTGMLWGRPAWGIWWAWDARLTSYLMLFLLYVSYLLVRKFSSNSQAPVIAAVLSVFAGIDVPIVFESITWWRTQHPAPVLRGEGQLDPTMKAALFWNLGAWFLWGCALIWARYAIIRREQQIAEHEALTALEA